MAGFDRGDRGDRGGRGGGGFRKGGFGGGSRPPFRGGGRGDRPTEMHDAVCNSCGKDCQVPFRPTGDKPVFCRDCFSKQGGGRELGRQAGERGSTGATHSMAPTMSQRSNDNSANTGELKRQIEQVSNKLDKLMSIVQGMNKPQTQKMAEVQVSAPSKQENKKVAKVIKKVATKAVKKVVANKGIAKKISKK